MGFLEVLQNALEGECRKLHAGESVRISIGPQADANTIFAMRSAVEVLYREMFREELRIEEIHRDGNDVLHIIVLKD